MGMYQIIIFVVIYIITIIIFIGLFYIEHRDNKLLHADLKIAMDAACACEHKRHQLAAIAKQHKIYLCVDTEPGHYSIFNTISGELISPVPLDAINGYLISYEEALKQGINTPSMEQVSIISKGMVNK